jgi:hypothetical protein
MLFLALPAALVLAVPVSAATAPPVTVVRHDTDRRVDVLVDGQPFTSYLWPESISKPVLYPLRTASGKVVTRGFPLQPLPGDPTDHPHHIGMWLNHADVQGVDFWNSTPAARAKRPQKMGTIVHRSIDTARGGAGQGELAVKADWVMPDGKTAVHETTRFTFAAAVGRRAIDRMTTLAAADAAVPFNDEKDGFFALRLAHVLEQPSPKNAAATGLYRSSEGKTGDDVWSTRGRWMMLTGKVDGEPVTIAVLDHPSNFGFPTYWHARGYGLFAANPLGGKPFTKGKEASNFSLAKGKPARFVYRVVILSREAKPEEVEAEYQRFVKDVK